MALNYVVANIHTIGYLHRADEFIYAASWSSVYGCPVVPSIVGSVKSPMARVVALVLVVDVLPNV